MNINVTKPYLPPIEDYQRLLAGVWRRNWLTNNGPLVHELEMQLKEVLGVDYLLLTTNGTVALQIAIKALELTGEIITTPFSYVATTSSIVWEQCEPVMVDIRPDTLMIDPELIEAAITPRTSAILATHVFGNACNVDAIADIAARRGLKVVYDAAHAFGTKLKGRSLFSSGDISTASFHATKLFHTVEGGALFTSSRELFDRMSMLRNFGHISATEFGGLGINGKNSEFHAAMGLCMLPRVPELIAARARVVQHYDERLSGLPIQRPTVDPDCEHNHAYYPVLLDSEDTLIDVVSVLNRHNIFPRRYFYPSLDALPYIKREFAVPVSQGVSSRILCLPLYESLSLEETDMICRLVRSVVRP